MCGVTPTVSMQTILKASSLFMLYFILESGREHKEEIGTWVFTLKMLQRSIKQRIWNTVLFIFFVNHIHRVVFLPSPLSFVIMLFTMAK